jgi:hypothetical protein
MPPDAGQILRLIAQVLEAPLIQAGAFTGAFFLLFFLMYLVRELFDNARSKYRR